MTRDHIGDNFQQETKYIRGRPPAGHSEHITKTPLYKRYSSAKPISLPAPETQEGGPIWDTIRKRRSIRDFKDTPIPLTTLSQLLWATQGITAKEGHFSFRTVPSAGALYPIETYLVVNNVEGLEKGVYHYAVDGHELEMVREGDVRLKIARAALNQDMCAEANVVFIWTAIFNRSKWKYKQRAYRYVYLDAGHICQNLALGAVALGLGTCSIAAFYDDEVNELLGVDGKEESALFLCAVGNEK